VNHLNRKAKALRQGHRFFELAARQTGRIGDRGERLCAQDLVGNNRQKYGIYAAGIGDQTGTIGREQMTQSFQLFVCHSGKLALLAGNVESPGLTTGRNLFAWER